MSRRPATLAGATLVESLDLAAGRHPASTATFPASSERLTLPEIAAASRVVAAALAARGVRPGDVVGVLMQTRAAFLTTLFGVLRLGAAASVLPTPGAAADGGAHAGRLATICDIGGIRQVVADDGMVPLVAEVAARTTAVAPRAVTPAELAEPLAEPAAEPGDRPVVAAGDLAVIQFTSGSTADPKGVMLTHGTVMAGLSACVVSGGFSPDDVFTQWVPHFHDMGLIGLLSNLLNGSDVHVFSPMYFLRHPGRILTYLSEHRASIFTGPNFCYDYLAEAAADLDLSTLDLSAWRLAFNGAEPVDAGTVRRFGEALAPAGLPATTMYPVYGMAEATLAISFPAPGSPQHVEWVDRDRLATGRRAVRVAPGSAAGKAIVSCGRPVHGLRLRVVGEDGAAVADGGLGEIQIQGPAVSPGYFRNPAATAAARDGDWFRTGDLGVLLDGELYVTGRLKDMIIVRGVNFFAEDVEAIGRRHPGVLRGNCVAVAQNSTGAEHLAVVVEAGRGVDADELATDLLQTVRKELGLDEVVVHVVPPRWIPRTTSGKWRRGAARRQLESGARRTLATLSTSTMS
jgi:fatty-acyl-CoA synthase